MKSSNPASSSSKSKKSKDKKKSRPSSESGTENSNEKSKETHKHSKMYAGFGSNTVTCVIDQSLPEQLPEPLKDAIADEVTYKVRELIHNARVRMHQNKRKRLKVSDVNAAMQSSNVERIYGPESLQWETIDDSDSYYYLKDTPVYIPDFISTSNKLLQRGPPALRSSWLSVSNDDHQKYFEAATKAVMYGCKSVSQAALKNIRNNKNMSRAIPMFLKFSYLALMTECPDRNTVLMLLRCIANNPRSAWVHLDKECKLLLLVLISLLYTSSYSSEDKDELCSAINALQRCWHVDRSIVLETIVLYACEFNKTENYPYFTKHIIYVLCELGIEIMHQLFWLHLPQFCENMNKKWDHDFACALLHASTFVYRYNSFTTEWDRMMYGILGDSILPRRVYAYLIKDKNDEDELYQIKKNNIKFSILDISSFQGDYKKNYMKLRPPVKRKSISIILKSSSKIISQPEVTYNKNNIKFKPDLVPQGYILISKGRCLKKMTKSHKCKSHSLFTCL